MHGSKHEPLAKAHLIRSANLPTFLPHTAENLIIHVIIIYTLVVINVPLGADKTLIINSN